MRFLTCCSVIYNIASLSHGYQTPSKKISAVSTYFETMPYRLDEKTGRIDYDMLEKTAQLYRPKILIAGASAYARLYDYDRMRKIADSVGAYLMSDMAHISGLVAAGVIPSPFEKSDIVTTTTHKSLRGPRGAMIFYRKGVKKVDKRGKPIMWDLEEKINFSVFPGHQGGPHNHTISALAVALKQAQSSEFKTYQQAVLDNCQAFAKELTKRGYQLVSGGTDTHLLLVDLKPKGIDGARVERILELINIATNKNTVPGDKSALIPGGIRMGTPAMTTRGLDKADFEKIADFFDRGVEMTIRLKGIQEEQMKGQGPIKFKDFKEWVDREGAKEVGLAELKKEVTAFASKFDVIESGSQL